MPLEVKIRRPDNNASFDISLKDARVIMNITRDPIVLQVANNKVVGVDIQKTSRSFTITGDVTIEGAVTALKQVENMENAALTWSTFGSGLTRGQLYFFWGKKDDATDKVYRCYIRRLTITNVSEQFGGAGTVFQFVLELVEIGTLSTFG